MLSQLRSEWYQVRKANSVKITFFIVFVASLIFGTKSLSDANFVGIGEEYKVYGGGSVYNMMQDSAAALLVASLFAGWLIAGGFENRIIQGALASGKSRMQVYVARMITYLMTVTGICLVYFVVTSLPAFARNGLGTEQICGNLYQIKYIVGMVVTGMAAYLSLFSLCGVVGFCCHRVGVTMGICFVGILFGGNLLAAILPKNILNMVDNTPLGLFHQVLKLDVEWGDMIRTTGMGILWTAIICVLGYLHFRKAELK